MFNIFLRILAFFATLLFFIMAGFTAGVHEYLICVTCVIAGCFFFQISRNEKISWIHRCINYGYCLTAIILNLYQGNVSYIDMCVFVAISTLWAYDFKEVRECCKPPSN